MSADLIWLSLGVLLLIVEILTGGFWIGFFALGALITSLVVWLGLAGGINGQVGTFLIASVLSLITLRGPLKRWLVREAPSDTFGDPSGQLATVTQEIPAGGTGRVTYQGSTWDAESVGDESVPVDTVVRIRRQEGMRLFVQILDQP